MTVSLIHVPRTGGMSLMASLKEDLGPDQCRWLGLPFYGQGKCHEEIIRNCSGVRLVGGHYGWKKIPWVTWTTVLRDPVERVVSYYFQLKRLTFNRPRKCHEAAKKLSLEKWVEECWWEISNLATRMLTGCPGFLPTTPIFEEAEKTLNLCHWSGLQVV